MTMVPRLPAFYFEKLLDSSPDIVVAVDRAGTIIFYNDGARRTLDYASGEVLGQHVTRLYPDQAEARKVMDAMRRGHDSVPGRVKNFETVFVTASGARIPVAISGSIIRDAHGKELGSIGFAKDLREIRRHDQLATLGEVAVSIAHEINNPLAVILNNLTLLESKMARVLPDDEYIIESERFESTHAALSRIQAIIARLTEMAGGTEYSTRQYLPGTQMTDLRIDGRGVTPCAAPTGDLSGIRLLVIDDDLGVCHSLRDLLADHGCQVSIATSGRAGLDQLGRTAVDLVLSDVCMPDMDGYQVFETVRRDHPETPVVLMTAFTFDREHVIKRSKIAGLEDVVYKKPIDPQRLLDIIGRTARKVA